MVPVISCSFFIPVAKVLQEFDLALRGKKKRKKFMKDAKKKGEITVSALSFEAGSLSSEMGQGCLPVLFHTHTPSSP